MLIGIDASRAFLKDRTGIEEYSYQVIEHLKDKLNSHQVILYVRDGQQSTVNSQQFPNNWKIKIIKWPRFWTQIGLSLEMFLYPVDVLFVPAHTVPLIHPAKTIVTIHGLEYEFCPEAYSFLERLYMRCSIKNSCQWAQKIIAVSENTKKDLIDLYKVSEGKIDVIYEGISTNYPAIAGPRRGGGELDTNIRITNNDEKTEANKLTKLKAKSYLLFVGRLEQRKNIIGIIQAFETLKEQYKIPHKLVLAGKPGFGYEKIKSEIANANCRQDILELGFVSEEEKWELLKNAAIFVFPTLYEGFGLPILEAQAAGVPVVASSNSSIPEVVNLNCHSERSVSGVEESEPRSLDYTRDDNCSALLVDPKNSEAIADVVYKLISDESLKNAMIQKGYENVKRFSWEKCAAQIAALLNGQMAAKQKNG